MAIKIPSFPQLGLVLAFACAMAVGACAPTKDTRGNFLDDDRLKALQVGVSSKDEVQQKLGSPTTTDPFDTNTWFYIGEKTSTEAFFDPKIDARKVVVLKFDQNDLLASANQLDEKQGKMVQVVKKTTPAPGREMNAFEQFISNLGKFNQGSMGNPANPGR
jgi:outer membrane protein assembly factor BamE (lipoprotein component of BamABCDE complex)